MHDRKRLPIDFIFDPKAAEQRTVALKNLLEGRQQERLAETPRARQEINTTPAQQVVDVFGLVDVQKIAFAQFAKTLNTYR